MCEPVVLLSRDESETREVGRCLGAVMRGGERIGLSGELGTGKTCLVRGLAEGLGIAPECVRSPSFTLLVPYPGGRLPLYHIDLFRVPADAADAHAVREYVYGAGVCAIEWFERFGEPLQDFLQISFTFVGSENRRLVAVGHGVGYHRMIEALRGMARS